MRRRSALPCIALLSMSLARQRRMRRQAAAARNPLRGPKTLRRQEGTLVQSIQVDQPSWREVLVGTNVVYSAVHEFGFGNIPARPYMGPALDESQDLIEQIVGRAIDAAISTGGGELPNTYFFG